MNDDLKTINPEEDKRNNVKNNKIIVNYFVLLVAVVILLIGSFWLGLEKGRKENSNATDAKFPLEKTLIFNKDRAQMYSIDFSLFWKVWDLLKENYVDAQNLDAKKLFYGAIKGMLAATGDPYTTFFDPEENKRFNEEISGSFDGIGIEIGMKNDILTVIAPLEGTPAEKAGLRAGDKILKINDRITSEMTIDEAVKEMRGVKGTEVKLIILHNNGEETQEITIQRDTISVKSIKLEFKENDISYLKISRFGEDTSRDFNLSLQKIVAKKNQKIILDLRNDPGGYLESAIDLASRMLPKGKVVVIEESRDKKQKSMYARGGDITSDIPTVILINEGSASASEILAGALRDNRENVRLVGEKSFGKGSVQERIDLSGGETAVKITVAKWLTPKGEQINEKGISPDVEVKLSPEDYEKNLDPQLDKAIEIIKGM